MKVIELLNKIANDEETPKKIKYNNIVYHRQWSDYMGDEPIDEYYIDDNSFSWMTEMDLKLDSEIEIIEEPKKIEHIQIGYTEEAITNYKRANFNSNDMEHICRSIGFMMANINKINDKFIEIIDYINKENK